MLQGMASTDYLSQLRDCTTTIKSVNKTDALTLLTTFGSLKSMMDAEVDELQQVQAEFRCPLDVLKSKLEFVSRLMFWFASFATNIDTNGQRRPQKNASRCKNVRHHLKWS
jgi:hypothetical protein